MLKTGLLLGSFFALMTVVLGAFGAHALKDQLSEYGKSIYEKGIFYQMFHSLAILLTVILNQHLEGINFSLSSIKVQYILIKSLTLLAVKK